MGFRSGQRQAQWERGSSRGGRHPRPRPVPRLPRGPRTLVPQSSPSVLRVAWPPDPQLSHLCFSVTVASTPSPVPTGYLARYSDVAVREALLTQTQCASSQPKYPAVARHGCWA